jgi:hypothetical protein
MDEKRIEPPTRRTAMRGVGALGMGLLASLSLMPAAAKKKSRAKIGPPGPAGPAGPAGPTGPAAPPLQTRVEFSTNSSPLPTAQGSTVEATANCGGAGKVVSCGYQVNGDTEQLLDVIVEFVKPDNTRSTCVASLRRVLTNSSTAGATIQAVAICLT